MTDVARERFNKIYLRRGDPHYGGWEFPNDWEWLNGDYERAKSRIAPIKIKPKRVLDVGCGEGAFVGAIIDTYPSCEAYGIDISEVGLEHARERFPKGKFSIADVNERFPFEDNYFDLVFSEGVLHILGESPDYAIGEIYRVLKKGGLFICWVGHRHIDTMPLSQFKILDKENQIFQKP